MIYASHGPKVQKHSFSCSIAVLQTEDERKRLQCLGIEMKGILKSMADTDLKKKKKNLFPITREEVAINTTLQLSIFGGYSHLPISLSAAQQTDHCPDKHNHLEHRFSEHLSVGNNV